MASQRDTVARGRWFLDEACWSQYLSQIKGVFSVAMSHKEKRERSHTRRMTADKSRCHQATFPYISIYLFLAA
jgi:hypothetical protein